MGAMFVSSRTGVSIGWTTGLLCAGLRVALVLGLLVGGPRGVGHAPRAVAATPLPCTTTPHVVPYGADARQFGVLRVPAGPGPHPVAVIIHGGCWLNTFTLDLMEGVSAALTAAGLATWNIEYRRLGDPGGGYPQTFTDVGRAIDTVRDLAHQCPLDLGKVLTVGHSAGGHLGVWAAARPRLPLGHPLRGTAPLPLTAVVALAGVLDLAASVAHTACGPRAAQLLGGSPAQVPARYAATSPSALVPLGIRQLLIHGTADTLVPLAVSQQYQQRALAAGDREVQLQTIPHGDHFALITPSSPQWPQVLAWIVALVR